MVTSDLKSAGTVGMAIAKQAQAQGDKVACTFLCAHLPPQQLTYQQLHQQASNYANYLRGSAIGPGDIVLLAGQHDPTLLVAFVGALYAGAVPAIFPYVARYRNFELYAQRLGERAAWANAHAILIDANFHAELLPQLTTLDCQIHTFGAHGPENYANATQTNGLVSIPAPDVRPPTAPAYLQFSSGTTGDPKGVVVSHDATLRHIRALGAALDLCPADVLVGWPPFHHDLGLIGYLLLPLLTGTAVVTIDPNFWVRRPYTLLHAIQDHGGTWGIWPHFTLAHLLNTVRDRDLAGLQLHSLRWLIVCAEVIQQNTLQAFQRRFQPHGLPPDALATAYGMAESVLGATLSPANRGAGCDIISKRTLLAEQRAKPLPATDPDATAIVDCGVPIRDTQVKIVDDQGFSLPDRQVGEIVIDAPYLFDGYLQRPDLTAATLRAGQLYTGDLGYLVDGHLFVVDRKQDLIITAGKNLYPESIERLALAELGKFAGRAAAFGVRDDRLGTELPVLVCEMRGRMEDEQQHRCRHQIRRRVQEELDVSLADIQLVRRGWLAITTSGKVARAATREKYVTLGLQPQPTALLSPTLLHQSSAEIEACLGAFFGDILGGAPIVATTNLFDVGVSSLRLAQVVAQLEQTYNCTIPIEQFVQQPTIAQLTKFLRTAHPIAVPTSTVLDLPLRRFAYSKDRRLNSFLNNGLMWHKLALPYALGLRLQRRWLTQRRVQEECFRQPLTMVKYMASQVGETALSEAILRSLMCNIWSFWRVHHLRQPATFARWCTVHSTDADWPPKQTGGGVIYALTHTPDSCCFPQALQMHGINPTIMAAGRTAEFEPRQIQALQVYRAQQTLREGGVVIIFADGPFGKDGITVDFWGGRRVFRSGMAALAETSGASLIPVFSSFSPNGSVAFELSEPLVAHGATPDARIESRLYAYADLLRQRWSQLYSNLWWPFLHPLPQNSQHTQKLVRHNEQSSLT